MTNNTTGPLVRKRSSKYLLMFFLSFERLKYVKIANHAFIGIQNYIKLTDMGKLKYHLLYDLKYLGSIHK